MIDLVTQSNVSIEESQEKKYLKRWYLNGSDCFLSWFCLFVCYSLMKGGQLNEGKRIQKGNLVTGTSNRDDAGENSSFGNMCQVLGCAPYFNSSKSPMKLNYYYFVNIRYEGRGDKNQAAVIRRASVHLVNKQGLVF